MERQTRTVKRIVAGKRTTDGAGVKLVRVFGHKDTADFDPFLMLDAFDSTNPDDYVRGFPWHPHRGIETITYLIQGSIEHGDSLGNKGRIGDGDCQWMTAGSGIIHQEMPQPGERMLGVQLWLNLPAKDKMTVPQYNGILQSDIPVVEEPNSKVHVIAGIYQGVDGAMTGHYVKPLYLDVELKPGAQWQLETTPEWNLFVYILQGAGTFANETEGLIAEKQAVLFEEGDVFMTKAAEQGMRFLLLAAPMLKEPVAWGGPIVMNTKEELDLAFQELEDNTFVK